MNRSFSHPPLRAEKPLYALALFASAAAVWAHLTPIEISARSRGIVRPEGETVKIVSETSGKITHVYVREGADVLVGDPIIRLDGAELLVKRRMIEERIHFTELRLASLRERLDRATRIEAQAGALEGLEHETAMIAAEALVEHARLRFLLSQQLLEEGLISRQNYEEARSSYTQAQTEQYRIGSRDPGLRKAQSEARLRDLEDDLSPVRAELADLYQQLEQNRHEIGRLTVNSPADGTITSLSGLHAGEVISAGFLVAALVPRSHALVIEAWLPSAERHLVDPGQPVRVQTDTISTGHYNGFDGVVLSISPDARFNESLAGAYRVLITPGAHSPGLRLGMTFQVHFITREERLLWLLFQRIRNSFDR